MRLFGLVAVSKSWTGRSRSEQNVKSLYRLSGSMRLFELFEVSKSWIGTSSSEDKWFSPPPSLSFILNNLKMGIKAFGGGEEILKDLIQRSRCTRERYLSWTRRTSQHVNDWWNCIYLELETLHCTT